jgi:hypothetical protein
MSIHVLDHVWHSSPHKGTAQDKIGDRAHIPARLCALPLRAPRGGTARGGARDV